MGGSHHPPRDKRHRTSRGRCTYREADGWFFSSSSKAKQKVASKSKSTTTSLWLASNPSKRWGEIFFLAYTPFWLTLCLGIVVPYKLYESFTELEYLPLGLISALPTFLIPLILVGKVDRSMHLKDRYWVKVPHTTFLLTHVCFLFYHVASNMTLRRLQNSVAGLPSSIQCVTEEAAWVLALAYFIAYLETIAISNFPYYQFVDRASMIDEKPDSLWDLPRVAVDALGAAMFVTIIRIFLGPIISVADSKHCLQPGLPWFSQNSTTV